MWSFAALCDEFCVTTRLYLKLELEPSRETLLHFMERLRRAFPRLSRLRRREDGAIVLDEEPSEDGTRRYVRLEPTSLKFGFYRPPSAEAVNEFADLVLSQAPAHLSLSDLDYDYMEVAYGFDLEYRGNHDELVAETLFAGHPLLAALTSGDERTIDCQPFLGVTLSPDCDKQVYVDLKGRTSTFEIRTGEFETTPLSVFLTARQYWGFAGEKDILAVQHDLLSIGEHYSNEVALPHVVQPLVAAIAKRR